MQLIYENNQFVFKCGFQDKEIPKEAGFRWNREGKFWFTTEETKAATLANYASEEIKARLAHLIEEKKEVIATSQAEDSDLDIPCNPGLAYLPYQRGGIAYAENRENVLIADEMGLGKTIQGIGICNLDPNVKNVLIICPASLKLNWQREFKKWDVKKLSVGVCNSDMFPRTDVVIINYDILKKFEYALRIRDWDVMIVDEAHYLKNPKALRTLQVIGRKDKKDPTKDITPIPAKKKVFLTGTPILNRPAEAWTICNFLAPKVFSNWYAFVKRYAGAFRDRFGYNTAGATNLGELQIKLRESIMVRRLKADVLKDLPAKRRQIIEFDSEGVKEVENEKRQWANHKEKIEALKLAVELAKAESEEIYKQAVKNLQEGMSVAFGDMARVRHETALAKVPFVIEHVEDSLEGGKVILFAHHKDVIAQFVEHFGKKCVFITGDVSIEQRQKAVDEFQNNPEVTLFVGNIKAAGVGLTLTASSHVIFAELDWVPGNMTQCEDRAHRIGQHDSVLCQHLVLAGSLDAQIANTLIEKQEIIEKALDNPEVIIPEAEPVKPATASISREKIEKEAIEISMQEIEEIHRKLKFLSAMCDGANSVDGMGFNKIDTCIGHSLARAPRLTNKQAVLGRKLINKYRRQLAN